MAETFVIDASCIISWVFDEQESAQVVEQILKDQLSGKIALSAPTIWLYETINSVKSAILRSRIVAAKSNSYFQKIIEVTPQLWDFAPFCHDTFEIAKKFDISVYDASYVSLAKLQNCYFLTGDEKLYRKVTGKIRFIKPVASYPKL